MGRYKKKMLVIVFLISGVFSAFAQDYIITRLPFNTKRYDEFAPVYFQDGIIFCSNRKTGVFVNYTDDRNGDFLFDLYRVAQKTRTKWGEVKILSNKINTNFNEGPATFNNRETEMFFTRNNEASKKIGNSINRKNRLGIFSGKNTRNGWKNIKAFQYNNTNYNVAHPSLSDDGNFLYFASDMPGGFGGIDLYVCEKNRGRWGKPENLGAEVNTKGDEVFPFIHQSGRLYFSSDEHGSIGRLDIFYTEKVNGEWYKPIALDQPINSRYDDFGLIIDAFKKSGLFCSDRNKSDDIYSFITLFPIFENMFRMKENNFCYEFFEKGSVNTDSLQLKYEWDFGDGEKAKGLEVEHCFKNTGNYIVQLNVIDEITGDVYFNEATYQLPIEKIEQVYINCKDTVLVGEEIKMDGYQTNLKNFDIAEYYWDFGDGRRTKGIDITHIYSSPGIYIVQLGVFSKEDAQGNKKKQGVYKNIVVLDKKKK